MATASPGSHDAAPNSEVSTTVPASSLSGETTAPAAQMGVGDVLGGFPDASEMTKVVTVTEATETGA